MNHGKDVSEGEIPYWAAPTHSTTFRAGVSPLHRKPVCDAEGTKGVSAGETAVIDQVLNQQVERKNAHIGDVENFETNRTFHFVAKFIE